MTQLEVIERLRLFVDKKVTIEFADGDVLDVIIDFVGSDGTFVSYWLKRKETRMSQW